MSVAQISEQVKACFGERLKQLRVEAGLSQDGLGQRLGISRGSVGFYENFERKADIAVLYAAAQYFNVSVEYLLGISPYRGSFLSSEIQDAGTSVSAPFAAMRASELLREMAKCLADYGALFAGREEEESAFGRVEECLFKAMLAPIASYAAAAATLKEGSSVSRAIREISEKPDNHALEMAALLAALYEEGIINGNSTQTRG
ncbi:MAG: helix-turn-helix transcriptional regulator [Oscillospiraceae bacterium]|nr:helix-turn-helix transcriptional regulator [Oscillospiraceae bacterium]